MWARHCPLAWRCHSEQYGQCSCHYEAFGQQFLDHCFFSQVIWSQMLSGVCLIEVQILIQEGWGWALTFCVSNRLSVDPSAAGPLAIV